MKGGLPHVKQLSAHLLPETQFRDIKDTLLP